MVDDIARFFPPSFNHLPQSGGSTESPLIVSGCPTYLKQAVAERSLINPREKHSLVLVN